VSVKFEQLYKKRIKTNKLEKKNNEASTEPKTKFINSFMKIKGVEEF